MVLCVALAMVVLIPVVYFLLPEWPGDVGQTPFGGTSLVAPALADAPPGHPTEIRESGNPLKTALDEGARNRDFWLLSTTFFICGFTTNGLVGTHMIALCHDYGMAAVTADSLLAIANKSFGIRKAPILFGWISASHQIGAASATSLAGASRTASGSYLQSFVVAGFVAVLAAFLSLMLLRAPKPQPA